MIVLPDSRRVFPNASDSIPATVSGIPVSFTKVKVVLRSSGYAWPTMMHHVYRREQRKQGAGEYGGVVKSMVEEKAARLDVASQLRKDKEGRGRCK